MPTQNDIPVAQRINSAARPTTHPLVRSFKALPWWGYGLATVAFFLPVIGMRFMFGLPESTSVANNQKPIAIAPVASTAQSPGIVTDSTLSRSPTETTAGNSPEQIFGHLAYAEASPSTLRAISRTNDGYEIRLREPAAQAFLNMVAAARANGVELVPISGFRTVEEQKKLFFDISKQRNQTPAQRAMVSAPPGYSEHHTGYAVDIGDGSAPSSNLSTEFEKTQAFHWLEQNAPQFGFELSFRPNNPQGVSYEPWHWRFVGDSDSLATFYKNQPQGQPNSRTSAATR